MTLCLSFKQLHHSYKLCWKKSEFPLYHSATIRKNISYALNLTFFIIIQGMDPPALQWPSLFDQCSKLILNWLLVFILSKQCQMILEKQLMPTGTGSMEKVYYQVNFCCNNRIIKAQKLRLFDILVILDKNVACHWSLSLAEPQYLNTVFP